MTLLSHLSANADELPLPADARLCQLGSAAWQAALAEASDKAQAALAREWSATPAGRRLITALFGNSPFLSGLAVAEWDFLTRLVTEGCDGPFAEIAADVERHDDRGENQAALMHRLRRARRRVALLVAVADLVGFWPLERQMTALSRFADAAVGTAVRHLLRDAAASRGMAIADRDDPERGSGLIVLGMGKLGGEELNYSSDIDLILLFDPARQLRSAQDAVQSSFSRLARDLVRILDERTSDGYVFRVDLRLRPDPRSTPLAISLPAALTYYETVGQNWERAALIKARPVAGDRLAAQRFLAELQPFIWRRHLDFAAIRDIHSIKRQIDAHQRGSRVAVAGHDIKLGRGGIREVEFFAQTQQLIWGGRMPQLRVRQTCAALQQLATLGRIDARTADALIADYRFLRQVEHRLQMVDDAQTHRLPADEAGVARFATFFGHCEPEGFIAALRRHLGSVERAYAELFEEASSLAGPGNLVFTGADDDPDTLATLAQFGFAEPARVAALVRGWHHGRLRATRSQRAREILTELAPELLRVFGATAHPDTALNRFDQFLARLPAGIQLFSLLAANPGLLSLVADIMAEAPFLADNLAQRPALLDAVLTDGFSARPPDRAGLAADIAVLLGPTRDIEDRLDVVRHWANERRFQIGVQLLHGGIDGSGAGHALSDIAATALAALLPAIAAEFVRTHGTVPGGAFAIVAMGRLGSREMSFASDLDLILIYDAPADSAGSAGPRPLIAPAYYARLSQRLISAITAPTAEGRLYEVDMRLRPSGESGPIASSLAAFTQYQREEAWTWEHMALTRARPIAGDALLQQRIAAAITAALTAPRDGHRLLADVADMRQRIAASHPRPFAWDLRYRKGGLVDLEFIAQYLMLREAARRPAVLRRDPGEALVALAAADALPPHAAHELNEALTLLRRLRALMALLLDGAPDPAALAGPGGATLARCAGAIDFARLEADMTAACGRVTAWYERLIARPARRLVASSCDRSGESAG
jgi:[glutamine synthetase] adenylyltransferase / [glutamine synthetase]-adenylyl-L-tyrosine phosphorylase